jgi:hypothetical protein
MQKRDFRSSAPAFLDTAQNKPVKGFVSQKNFICTQLTIDVDGLPVCPRSRGVGLLRGSQANFAVVHGNPCVNCSLSFSCRALRDLEATDYPGLTFGISGHVNSFP